MCSFLAAVALVGAVVNAFQIPMGEVMSNVGVIWPYPAIRLWTVIYSVCLVSALLPGTGLAKRIELSMTPAYIGFALSSLSTSMVLTSTSFLSPASSAPSSKAAAATAVAAPLIFVLYACAYGLHLALQNSLVRHVVLSVWKDGRGATQDDRTVHTAKGSYHNDSSDEQLSVGGGSQDLETLTRIGRRMLEEIEDDIRRDRLNKQTIRAMRAFISEELDKHHRNVATDTRSVWSQLMVAKLRELDAQLSVYL